MNHLGQRLHLCWLGMHATGQRLVWKGAREGSGGGMAMCRKQRTGAESPPAHPQGI